MYVLTALFLFPMCLFQKELKFGRVVNSLAAWFGLWASFLVVLAGFYPVGWPLTCLGYDTWGGSSVLMDLLLVHWRVVIIESLGYMWGLGLSSGCRDGAFGWYT